MATDISKAERYCNRLFRRYGLARRLLRGDRWRVVRNQFRSNATCVEPIGARFRIDGGLTK
jgi:hypothetical protein